MHNSIVWSGSDRTGELFAHFLNKSAAIINSNRLWTDRNRSLRKRTVFRILGTHHKRISIVAVIHCRNIGTIRRHNIFGTNSYSRRHSL